MEITIRDKNESIERISILYGTNDYVVVVGMCGMAAPSLQTGMYVVQSLGNNVASLSIICSFFFKSLRRNVTFASGKTHRIMSPQSLSFKEPSSVRYFSTPTELYQESLIEVHFSCSRQSTLLHHSTEAVSSGL